MRGSTVQGTFLTALRHTYKLTTNGMLWEYTYSSTYRKLCVLKQMMGITTPADPSSRTSHWFLCIDQFAWHFVGGSRKVEIKPIHHISTSRSASYSVQNHFTHGRRFVVSVVVRKAWSVFVTRGPLALFSLSFCKGCWWCRCFPNCKGSRVFCGRPKRERGESSGFLEFIPPSVSQLFRSWVRLWWYSEVLWTVNLNES